MFLTNPAHNTSAPEYSHALKLTNTNFLDKSLFVSSLIWCSIFFNKNVLPVPHDEKIPTEIGNSISSFSKT